MANERPVQQFRIGAVQAAIWKNQTKNAEMLGVKFSRTFEHEGEFKNSSSFSNVELLIVAKLAHMAFNWIHEQQAK